MQNNSKISILGDGGWGTTLSLLLAKKGFQITLWSAFADYAEQIKKDRENKKFLPGVSIPSEVTITSDLKEAVEGAEVLVIAIPSQFLRDTIKGLKGLSLDEKIVVSVVKGIEHTALKRPSEVIREELGELKLAVLSGPTIAKEIAGGLPASCVVASDDEPVAKSVQEIFMSERFRVYTSADVAGVELGGALKNIIAIAAGISDGLNLGTNAKAGLFTRGLVEIKKLGIALGADAETFNGLSGIGDLVTTCISPLSRNRRVGEEIAKGKTLDEIIGSTDMIAEGVETARSVHQIAGQMHVDMPITEQVYKVLFENKNAHTAVGDLMARSKKSE